MAEILTVLVSMSCAGCAQALALARDFSRERPDVEVRIVDVDRPGWNSPAQYAGTPMFYVADTVVSYGNPSAQQLCDAFPRQVT